MVSEALRLWYQSANPPQHQDGKLFDPFKMRPSSEVVLGRTVVFGDWRALLSIDFREITKLIAVVTTDLQLRQDERVYSVPLAQINMLIFVTFKFSFLIRCSVQNVAELPGSKKACFKQLCSTFCFDLHQYN